MKTPGTSSAAYNAGRHHRSEASPDSRIYLPSITSQEILDENSQSGRNRFGGSRAGASRKAMIVLLVVVVAIAGAIVAFVVTKNGSSTTASNSSDGTTSSKTSGTSDSTKGSSKTTSTVSGGTDKSGNAKVYSDPTSGSYPLSAFAIGDWGQTIGQNQSCCTRRKGVYNGYDWHAEAGVAKLMDMEASSNKPSVVLSHGDNFYWTGIEGTKDQAYRFEQTFESRHKVAAMGNVPWINVMGNHDYGGGSFICLDSSEKAVACSSGDELIAALKQRFSWQATYKSPNNDRWVLTDHFYKYTISKGSVSMDIFNLDMNDAESHGANEICCQCYSYTLGNDTLCKTVTRGDKYCCKGDTAMYDACVGQFKSWGNEAMTKLASEVKASKATWKVVNSHYNPYGHYGETTGSKWLKTLDGLGVQLWIAGHTHGEKHDYASFGTHFIENGAGGGIQSEASSGIPPYASNDVTNLWSAPGFNDGGNTYGFFTLQASTDWLKVRFLTFDSSWSLTKTGSTLADSKVGGVKVGWCYYIPSDGSKGQPCSN